MKTLQAISLFFQNGNSDKEYHVQLQENTEGCVVNFQYGRRGSALKPGTKTNTPVSKADAEKIYAKLVKEKTSKGYTPSESGEVFSSQEFVARKSDISLQLSNPITTDSELEQYLKDDAYAMQEKYDGERRGVDNSATSAVGINRKSLEVQLSDCLVKDFFSKGIFDGEDMRKKLALFDVLEIEGRNLRHLPFSERIVILNQCQFGENVFVVTTANTETEKRALLKAVREKNGEGVVFKKKNAPYQAGRPNSGGDHIKFKFYKTATFIVSTQTKNKRSVGLTLLDGTKEVNVGKVTIPPNFQVPEVGDLVEVRYLYAYEGGAVYQPTYLGPRTDIDKEEATLDQLEYKQTA